MASRSSLSETRTVEALEAVAQSALLPPPPLPLLTRVTDVEDWSSCPPFGCSCAWWWSSSSASLVVLLQELVLTSLYSLGTALMGRTAPAAGDLPDWPPAPPRAGSPRWRGAGRSAGRFQRFF